MFKGAAAELLGRADICDVLRPAEFAEAASTSYLLTEDGETPLFVLRSKQDEYAFTDRALVHLDGTSALSKKRLVCRYPLATCEFRNVRLETAGTVDLDAEIKFVLGGREFSIDVAKKEIAALTALYKALTAVAEIQARGNAHMELAKLALERSASSLARGAGAGAAGAPALEPGAALINATDAAFNWLTHQYHTNNPTSFGPVFARYLNRLA